MDGTKNEYQVLITNGKVLTDRCVYADFYELSDTLKFYENMSGSTIPRVVAEFAKEAVVGIIIDWAPQGDSATITTQEA